MDWQMTAAVLAAVIAAVAATISFWQARSAGRQTKPRMMPYPLPKISCRCTERS
jgi:hypothetical protein